MENIEVHSKSFVIRWVHVSAHTEIAWSIFPTKRSINFGIYSSGDDTNPSLGHEISQAAGPLTDRLDSAGFESLSGGLARVEAKEVREGTLAFDKSQMLGFVFDNTFSISNSKLVRFSFNIEQLASYAESNGAHEHHHHHNHHDGNEPKTMGSALEHEQDPTTSAAAAAAASSALNARHPSTASASSIPRASSLNKSDNLSSSAASTALYSVPPVTSGTVRARSLSRAGKDAGKRRRGTLSVSTTAPAQLSDLSSHSFSGLESPNTAVFDDDESIRHKRHRQGTFSSTNTASAASENEPMRSLDGRFLTGFLQKKRRKQFQGFARRYFSLDKRTGLLNYYLNNRSSSLRGVMPIRMSQIKRDPKNNIMYLNSGMEKWALKSNDPKTFEVWWQELKEVQSSGMQDESELESEDDLTHHANSSSDAVTRTASTESGTRDQTPVVDTRSVDLTTPKSSAANPNLPTLDRLQSLISTLPQGKLRSDFDETYATLMREAHALTNGGNEKTEHQHHHAGNKSFPFNPRKAFGKSSHVSEATVTKSKLHGQDQTDIYHQLLHILKSRNFIGIFIIGTLIGLLFGFTYSSVFIIGSLFASAGAFSQFRKPQRPGHANESVSDNDVFAGAYSGAGGIDYGDSTSSAPTEIVSRDHDVGSLRSRGSGGSDEDDDYDLSDESDEDAASDNQASKRAGHGTVSYVPQRPRYDSATSSAMSKKYSSERDQGKWGSEDPDIAAAFSKLAAEHTKTALEAAESEIPAEAQVMTGETSEAKDAQGNVVKTVAAEKKEEDEGESAETSLYPLPHDPVHRRRQITGPAQPPPSLLALLKNANSGNAAAPIISNEPLSGVETIAEIFEDSDLLAAASKAPPQSHLRVMLVALFSVARLSSLRCKERVLRKPFTPLLGETFEMVREDREFRFVSEKVMHKPEVIASQAESPHWTAHFTSRPHSKMWAKSMQISDVGNFNVTFPDGEGVSFNNPEMFVRNIIGGERYVEPTGTVTVESNMEQHLTATVEFKAGGMFSGRSEEVKITSGKMVYEGKWTEAIYHKSKVVWSAKPLVDDPHRHYGWTVFAAQLNEITPIENSQLPPNDSRLRPDLRLYETQTDVDKAEKVKLALEQRQRERRKKLEDAQKQHEPFFFVKSNDSKGLYVLRTGARNYWVQRKKQDWANVPNYFKE